MDQYMVEAGGLNLKQARSPPRPAHLHGLMQEPSGHSSLVSTEHSLRSSAGKGIGRVASKVAMAGALSMAGKPLLPPSGSIRSSSSATEGVPSMNLVVDCAPARVTFEAVRGRLGEHGLGTHILRTLSERFGDSQFDVMLDTR